jgi:hypothetical protein
MVPVDRWELGDLIVTVRDEWMPGWDEAALVPWIEPRS